MELEDLKSAWKSVEPHIENASGHTKSGLSPQKRCDTKSKLLRRVYISAATTFICLVLMATSRLWALMRFPLSWLIATTLFIFIALLLELYLARLISKIDLWNFSHTEVLSAVIRVKRYYRHIELWMSALAMVIFGWITFLPPFVCSRQIVLPWILFAIGLGIEYIVYRKNIKNLDTLKEWTEENN